MPRENSDQELDQYGRPVKWGWDSEAGEWYQKTSRGSRAPRKPRHQRESHIRRQQETSAVLRPRQREISESPSPEPRRVQQRTDRTKDLFSASEIAKHFEEAYQIPRSGHRADKSGNQRRTDIEQKEIIQEFQEQEEAVSYTHLTLPTKRIV